MILHTRAHLHPASRFVSVEEAARQLGIGRNQLYGLIKLGRSPVKVVDVGTQGRAVYRVPLGELERIGPQRGQLGADRELATEKSGTP